MTVYRMLVECSKN